MRNLFILNRVFRYIFKNVKSKDIKKISIRKNFLKPEYTVVILMIIIVIIYGLISQKPKNTFLLLLTFFTMYNSVYVLFINKVISKKMEKEIYEFDKREKDKKRELIRKKYNINEIIVLDDYGDDKHIYKVLKNEYVIGKNSKSSIVDIDLTDQINSDFVSRRHARIYKQDNKFYVVDEGSKNGTDVIKTNNRKINLIAFKGENILVGDIIHIHGIEILLN